MDAHVVRHPVVLALVYASLAAPMLGILQHAPNPIIDLSGETSRGKTTALRVAASVWGNPSERAGGIIHSWQATASRLERLFSQHRHMPLLLDDTKRATSPAFVEETAYMHAQGVGRARARPDGARLTARWKSVLISTGEAPMNSYGGSGGARARALCIADAPFGREDNASGVAAATELFSTHYGHAGPAIVRWLMQHDAGRQAIRSRYDSIVADWSEQGRVAGRIGQTAALIELGKIACHDILGVAPPAADFDDRLRRWGLASASAADRAAGAISDVYGWAAAHEQAFWGRHHADRQGPRVPSGGWLGAWRQDERWEWIAVLRPQLHDVLTSLGYHSEEVIRSWGSRGWLITAADRHLTMATTIGDNGSRPRCYRIAREAIEQA